MKRIYIISLIISIAVQICMAQPYHDPIVYVSPNGSSTGTGIGTSFVTSAINADHFMENVYDSIYEGDVKVYFAGGDYYTDFVFWGIPTTIRSIQMYGGFNPESRRTTFAGRDLENYETRFHAVSQHLVWFEAVGYSNPNGWNTCIIDGITFTSDNTVNFQALRVVGGEHLISQCKFENFNTSTYLIFWETQGNTVTMTNCLFDNNNASYLMALCTNIDLINVTIADNYLGTAMFRPYNHGYTYTMQNTIIYGNNDMSMSSCYFDVSYSILEHSESWVNNISNNLFGVDPLFTYNIYQPYSCDFYNSPAIAAGNGAYLGLNTHHSLNDEILDFDVVNHDRYWDVPRTIVDIGAYQNGYDDNFYYYDDINPSIYRASPKRAEEETKSDTQIWANAKTVFINNSLGSGATMMLYNTLGEIIAVSALQPGLNTMNTALTPGIYIANVRSKDEKELMAKTIFIPE